MNYEKNVFRNSFLSLLLPNKKELYAEINCMYVTELSGEVINQEMIFAGTA